MFFSKILKMTKFALKPQITFILTLLKLFTAKECKINVFASIIVETRFTARDLSEYGFEKTCYCGEINRIVYTGSYFNPFVYSRQNGYILKLQYSPLCKNSIGILQICHSPNVEYTFVIFPHMDIPVVLFHFKPDGKDYVIILGDVKYSAIKTKTEIINSKIVDTFGFCAPYLQSGITVGYQLNPLYIINIFFYNQCKCDNKKYYRKYKKELLKLIEPIKRNHFGIKFLTLIYKSNVKRKEKFGLNCYVQT